MRRLRRAPLALAATAAALAACGCGTLQPAGSPGGAPAASGNPQPVMVAVRAYDQAHRALPWYESIARQQTLSLDCRERDPQAVNARRYDRAWRLHDQAHARFVRAVTALTQVGLTHPWRD